MATIQRQCKKNMVKFSNNQARYYSEQAAESARLASVYSATTEATATSAVSEIIEYRDTILESISASSTEAISVIVSATSDCTTTINDLKTSVLNTINGTATEMLTSITTMGTTVTDSIQEVGVSVTNSTTSVLAGLTESSLNSVNSAKTAALETISGTKTEVLATISATGTSYVNQMSTLKEQATTAASSASTSASNSSVWAEGSDEGVQALGGTHSAKEWCRYNSSVNQNDVRGLQGSLTNNIVFEYGDSESVNSRFEEIKNLAHSTFDRSKFTVTGSPTITNDGVFGHTSTTDFIKTTETIDFSQLDEYELTIGFNSSAASQDIQNLFWISSNNQNINTFQSYLTPYGKIQWNVWQTPSGGTQGQLFGRDSSFIIQHNIFHILKFKFTGTAYKLGHSTDGINYTWDTIFEGNTKCGASGNLQFGLKYQSFPLSNINIDLKYLSLKSGGAEILNGNKTGVDTYLINSETISIPYIWSSENNKIACASHRLKVKSLFDSRGFAQYFTLDEDNNDFKLPMGNLYGIIGQRALIDCYRNGITYWDLYNDKTLEVGGVCTSGVEYNLPKAFADTNYVLTIPYSAKTASSFTPSATGDFIAKGVSA